MLQYPVILTWTILGLAIISFIVLIGTGNFLAFGIVLCLSAFVAYLLNIFGIMNKWIPFLLLTIFFFSCEKNISLVPETQEPKLVVDAQIETGQSPVVILTNSINYFSEINSNLLMGSFVHNAKVTISDGVKTHQLKEYNIPVGGATYFFYANDFTNPATAITGENGKQYSLTISFLNPRATTMS